MSGMPCGTDSIPYDHGAADLAIGFNGDTVVSVHVVQENGQDQLWYRVGQIPPGSGVAWSDSQPYDAGSYPSVAGDENVVLVSQQAPGPVLWCRVGILIPSTTSTAPPTIEWGTSQPYPNGSGAHSSVALVGETLAIEFHESPQPGNLYYRFGALSRDSKTIAWDDPQSYWIGTRPSVAAAPSYPGDGTTSVFVIAQGLDGRLYSRVGVVDEGAKTVRHWGDFQDIGGGVAPSIAAVYTGEVAEVHQAGDGVGPLWTRRGRVHGDQITWQDSVAYGTGYKPCIGYQYGRADTDTPSCFEAHMADLDPGTLVCQALGGEPHIP